MNGFDGIIKQLEAQKAAIDKALSALHEVEGGAVDDASVVAPVTAKKRGRPAKRKGGMTPEGKARLVAALKRRWAAKKAAGVAAPAKASRKGGMTPEGRKRLAEAMKRRWAVKRTAAQAKKRSKSAKPQ